MIIPLLFGFGGGLILIVLGLGYKYASVVKSRAGAYGSIFTAIAFLVCIAYSLLEPSAWGDARLWQIGIGMGVIFSTCIGLYTRANRIGPVSVSWVVINLASIVAIVLSIVVFKEPFFPRSDLLILALFLGMILFLYRGMKGDAKEGSGAIHPLFWPLILVSLVLNGIFIFLLKVKEHCFPDGSSGATMAICFGTACALITVTHVTMCCLRRETPWRRHDVKAGLLTGLGAGFGNVLVLGAMSLPAVVILPISQGIPMIGGVIAMAILYRERFNAAKVISLVLALGVLLLTIFRKTSL